MSRAKQCATVRTEGDAQSHNPVDTRTSGRTVGQPISLKDLAGAVLGRTTPRTKDAHFAQSSCTSSADEGHWVIGHDQVIDEDLERLIQAAAAYWHYDVDDLRLIRATAAVDPDGLRLALSSDPLKPFYDMDLDSLLGGAGESGRSTIKPERKHHADN